MDDWGVAPIFGNTHLERGGGTTNYRVAYVFVYIKEGGGGQYFFGGEFF